MLTEQGVPAIKSRGDRPGGTFSDLRNLRIAQLFHIGEPHDEAELDRQGIQGLLYLDVEQLFQELGFWCRGRCHRGGFQHGLAQLDVDNRGLTSTPAKFVDIGVKEDFQKPTLKPFRGTKALIRPERSQACFLNEILCEVPFTGRKLRGKGQEAVEMGDQGLLEMSRPRTGGRWFCG
jgi:hypothetical protein